MKHLKLFETTTGYQAYVADTANFIAPNVSLCEDARTTVYYNPFVGVTGVTINKSELSLNNGEIETLVATVLPSNASNKSVTWSSSNDSVATVSNSGLVTAVGGGNANITITTVDGGHTAQCALNVIDLYNGHDYIEIGGLKWATMNVGATSITGTGLYFQWGDTQGYTASQVGMGSGQKYFNWADYKYGNGTNDITSTGPSKYNATDGKTVLDVSDDAAQANWGGPWRMPTTVEYAALGNAVNTTWTTNYQGSGVAGLVCTDKTDSSKVLFFPAAGRFYSGSVHDKDYFGKCWSSSVYDSNLQSAYCFDFYDGSVDWQYNRTRCMAFPVRAVAD